jgi:hypothetical protein
VKVDLFSPALKSSHDGDGTINEQSREISMHMSGTARVSSPLEEHPSSGQQQPPFIISSSAF